MTEPTVGKLAVKVTPENIDSVSSKLQEFAQQLSPGEQNVVAWLLGRAASAPADELPTTTKIAPEQSSTFREVLNSSLGIPQFERLRPGQVFAGSGVSVTGTVNPTGPTVGVTGTIMF